MEETKHCTGTAPHKNSFFNHCYHCATTKTNRYVRGKNGLIDTIVKILSWHDTQAATHRATNAVVLYYYYYTLNAQNDFIKYALMVDIYV